MDTPPPTHGTLALDAFGLSYHNNRSVRWNERNPGIGITVTTEQSDSSDLMCSIGSYRDSLDERATYALTGLRYVVGERTSLHTYMGALTGVLYGSGNHGAVILPYLSIGYDRVDLCLTGSYARKSSGQPDSRLSSTSFVACFLSIAFLRF